jgi:predicted metal-dependent peptidase
VLVLDVSGSVEAPLLARFCGEIGALVRRLEAALVLVIGDDAVREVRRFEPGRARLEDLAVRGGGGTDFAPLLAEAVRHRPDLIVVLTDLEGPAGPPPRCPVLWAVPPSRAAARAPFGRVLVLG